MIGQRLWHRLEALKAKRRSTQVQHLLVCLDKGETLQELEAKIERWKAGEKVNGISQEYEGGEIDYGLPFEFVSPRDRR